VHYFPKSDEIGVFGPAFLHLMFAYAALERRVADLQDVITGNPDFSQRTRWKTHERGKEMRKLINEYQERLSVVLPEEVEPITSTLDRANSACELRNLLAHGHWWELGQETITVRRHKVVFGKQQRPRKEWHKTITMEEINRAADELENLEFELSCLQKPIEERLLRSRFGSQLDSLIYE
jgi:hypothetical protein